MGNVIGYKGSEADRFKAWDTLVTLKRHMRLSKMYGPQFKDSLEAEQKWYDEEFARYISPANDNEEEFLRAA